MPMNGTNSLGWYVGVLRSSVVCYRDCCQLIKQEPGEGEDYVCGIAYRIDSEKEDEVRAYLGRSPFADVIKKQTG